MPSTFIQWLKENMFACPFKRFFHIDCPGCGLQRSVIALLQGDPGTSLALYPATIPILVMAVATLLHLKYKFQHGAMFIKYNQFVIAIVIGVFYIYKLIHLKIPN